MKILIAGAGIGGLTAALCCLHHGHDVTLLERSTELGEAGAGIQIPPNAMKVFQALGLEKQLAAKAFMPEALEARMGKSGLRLFRVPILEHAVPRWGAPYLHIHRADYIDVLAKAFKASAPDLLHLGAAVESIQQTDQHVTCVLSGGSEVSGDVLIGADGIHSNVRADMLGTDVPTFTGNTAWRVVVPTSELGDQLPEPTACVWMGAGRHAVTYRLRRGELVNFVGVVERADWKEEGWQTKGKKVDALKDFEGWHPVITNLINTAAPDDFYCWALFDRPPLTQWVDERVALLGDAAHPMLPFMAQGAAMAVEDAWALASELSVAGRSESDSLLAYQARRYVRASRIQSMSRVNAKTFHQSGWLGQFMTYGPMWAAGHFLPSIIRQRLDHVYGHDETADTQVTSARV